MKQQYISNIDSDVHSYVVFANIEKKNKDVIEGHLVLLNTEEMEAIEQFILRKRTLKVKSETSYILEKEK